MLWKYAQSRSGVFDITPEDVEKMLIEAEQKWREIGIEFNYKGTNAQRAFSPSIDQIHPGKGYVLGNIQIVPWAWNALKGNSLTDKEAIEFCKKIAAAH
jgi:hypothetical protein